MEVFWQILMLLIGLVFWSYILRWVLGIYYLSGKLDKVLEELTEIKRRIGDQAPEQPSTQPEEASPQDEAENTEPQGEDKTDEPTTCMRCGQTIPAESSNCPACGWTWKPVSNENAGP